MNTLPLILHQATLTLYQADSNGDPILAQIVWMGARAEGVELMQEIAEVESTPSGASYPEYEPVFEENEIRIARIWVLPQDTLADYELSRNKHVMVIHGIDRRTGIWHRRTYYNVRGRRYDLRSNGIVHFGSDQVFRASHFVSTAGNTGDSGEELPVTPSDLDEFPILFTHDDALATGNYFLGVYQFAGAVTIGLCRAVGQGGASGTTLTLEVNGTLTAHTITLGAGPGEVTGSVTPSLAVSAGQTIRWKVTAGPGDAELAAVTCAVTG